MQKILEKFYSFSQKHYFLMAVLGLILFLLVLHASSFSVPFNRDEGEYAYSAQILKEGIMPYENSYLQKPPMIIYAYYFAQLFGSGYWAPRILSYLFIFFTAILIFFIVSKDFGKRAGISSLFFVPLLALLPGFDQFAANTEMFITLPIVGVLALYVLKKESSSNWNWVWFGVLSSTAVFYKYNIILIPLFVFSVWIVELWMKNRNIKEIFKKILFMLVGFGLTSLLILSPFLIHDGGKTLWECTASFNKYYSSSNIFGFSGFWYYLKLFFTNWWILFLISIIFFVKRPKKWWFYSGLTIISLVGTFGSWYGHYYILFAVFWATIIAYSIDILSDLICQKFYFNILEGEETRKVKFNPVKIRFFLVVSIIFITSLSLVQLIFASQEKFSKEKLGGENTFLDSVGIAEKIKKMTKPDDYVLVAGSEPQILYYSERKSPTRFVIFYPLMIDTPLAEKYQKEAIREIEKNSPKVIVYVNSYYSWTPGKNSPKIIIEFLDKYIEENYKLISGDKNKDKFLLYERTE